MTPREKQGPSPGIHPQFSFSGYSKTDEAIIRRLAQEWLVTGGSSRLQVGSSTYSTVLIKPTHLLSEMFNIDREVAVVLSSYPRIEPRVHEAFDSIQDRVGHLRIESLCRVLISGDPDVESNIETLLKTDPEQPIVIPFTYEELRNDNDTFLVTNRFRKHFYTRDLFAFLSPLRKDLYFFGRSELIQRLVNRHRTGEHTGLFGLRKSGKTSIVYAIERHLKAQGESFLSIDCETPSVHSLRWNELLRRIVRDYHKVRGSKAQLDLSDGRYSEANAADSFSDDMLAVHRSKKATSTLLLLDEIEQISPGTGSSPHWRDGNDFVYLWQSIRGFFQRNPGVVTYMLVGTNPTCVEKPVIAGYENPLFGSVPCQYVLSFELEQVRAMVSRLGRYMGLDFEEIVFSKLTDDFGGHPFLIRQMCSQIHRMSAAERPVRVDRTLYDAAKKKFYDDAMSYVEMIIHVLREWYPDEYEMLSFLAQGDTKSFDQFALDDARFTSHLVGYGLVHKGSHGYSFNIEIVKHYLTGIHRYERLHLPDREKRQEISDRRNQMELKLRKILKSALIASLGRKKALMAVLASLPENRRSAIDLDLDGLFSSESSPLYLPDLKNIIQREWELPFKNIFEGDKEDILYTLKYINQFGRADAHAKSVNDEDFQQLRLYFRRWEKMLDSLA